GVVGGVGHGVDIPLGSRQAVENGGQVVAALDLLYPPGQLRLGGGGLGFRLLRLGDLAVQFLVQAVGVGNLDFQQVGVAVGGHVPGGGHHQQQHQGRGHGSGGVEVGFGQGGGKQGFPEFGGILPC